MITFIVNVTFRGARTIRELRCDTLDEARAIAASMRMLPNVSIVSIADSLGHWIASSSF
jgi:hypothetical protein